VGEEVMEGQWGVPEREMETTDQPRWVAARQMRDPVVIIAISFVFASYSTYDIEVLRVVLLEDILWGSRTEEAVSTADYELLLCC
jgi:hypothetical protein